MKWTLAIACGAVISGLAATQRAEETMELKLEMLTDTTVFAPSQSIPFRLELVNVGSSMAQPISLGTNGRATRVTVRRESGEAVFSLCRDEATYARQQTLAVPGIDPRIELRPGQSDHAEFDVQVLQKIDHPGRYVLTASHTHDDVDLQTGEVAFEIRAAQVDAAQVFWQWVDASASTLRVLVRDTGVWHLRRASRRSPEFLDSSYPVPSLPREADLHLAAVSPYEARERDAVLWLQDDGLHVQIVQGRHVEAPVVAPLPAGAWDLLSACAHAENDAITAAFVRDDAAGKVVARGHFDAAGAQQSWDEITLDKSQTTHLTAGMTANGDLYVAWTRYSTERDETTVMVRPVTSAAEAKPRALGAVHGPALGLRFLPGTGGEALRLALLTRSVQRDDVLRYAVFDPIAAQTLSGERGLTLDAEQQWLRQWEVDEENGLIVVYEAKGSMSFAHVEGPRGAALPADAEATPPLTMVVAPEGYVFLLANAGARGLVAYLLLSPPGELE